MSDATLRIARPDEYRRVEAAYSAWGYGGGVSPEDVLHIAERGGELIGAVRRTHEHGVEMLRGMQVAPAWQRQGIGTRLLRAFVANLRDAACYCVPYAHLRMFYARAGFAPVADADTPRCLRDRVAAYRGRGLDVLVMLRPLGGGLLDRAGSRGAAADKAVGASACSRGQLPHPSASYPALGPRPRS